MASLRLKAGDQLGRYQLLRPMAAGGMATVWAAMQVGALPKVVAVKVLHPKLVGDANFVAMFVDEARAAAAIRHPAVCETYELGEEGPHHFIAMEWLAGESLADLVECDGSASPLPAEIAAAIVAQACGGLQAAHDALDAHGKPLQLVHRDVSPQNVMVTLNGFAKLTDFGVAKARDQLHATTRSGQIKGKFAYIPPEQILGKAVDARADIYAMGCVLYVAALGKRPFGKGAAAIHRSLSGEYVPPTAVDPTLPRGLAKIIETALATAPENRYQTAEDFQETLLEWSSAHGPYVGSTEIAAAVVKRTSAARRELHRRLRNPRAFLAEELERLRTTPTGPLDADPLDDDSSSSQVDPPRGRAQFVPAPEPSPVDDEDRTHSPTMLSEAATARPPKRS